MEEKNPYRNHVRAGFYTAVAGCGVGLAGILFGNIALQEQNTFNKDEVFYENCCPEFPIGLGLMTLAAPYAVYSAIRYDREEQKTQSS